MLLENRLWALATAQVWQDRRACAGAAAALSAFCCFLRHRDFPAEIGVCGPLLGPEPGGAGAAAGDLWPVYGGFVPELAKRLLTESSALRHAGPLLCKGTAALVNIAVRLQEIEQQQCAAGHQTARGIAITSTDIRQVELAAKSLLAAAEGSFSNLHSTPGIDIPSPLESWLGFISSMCHRGVQVLGIGPPAYDLPGARTLGAMANAGACDQTFLASNGSADHKWPSTAAAFSENCPVPATFLVESYKLKNNS